MTKAEQKEIEDYINKRFKSLFPGKEIKDKEWEILKCKSGSMGIHDFVPEGTCSTPCFKENKPCKIHSVKRLSDNEVFSIGDEIDYWAEDNKANGGSGIIESISISRMYPHELDFKIKDSNWKYSPATKFIKNIGHKPKEEQPFLWSDELVRDFVIYWSCKPHGSMEDFKKSKQQTNTIPSAYDSKSIKEYYDSESPTQSQPKTNSIKEDGFEDLKKWVNQHQNVKWVSDLTFSFIYQNKQCHGMITYLPFHFEITIRSVRSTDDIGNGCGFAVYKKFPRKVVSQPKTERIEIQGFCDTGSSISNYSGERYSMYAFNTTHKIPKEKFPLIKHSIEKILNNE